MRSLDRLLASHPTLCALGFIALGLANAALAYTHRHAPLRLVLDGAFAVGALGCAALLWGTGRARRRR